MTIIPNFDPYRFLDAPEPVGFQDSDLTADDWKGLK